MMPYVIGCVCFALGLGVMFISLWRPYRQSLHPAVHSLEDDAELCIQHVEEKFSNESGEFKKAQAFRMMLNRNPQHKERDISLALELAVHRCLDR
jgi:hypothetical protein